MGILKTYLLVVLAVVLAMPVSAQDMVPFDPSRDTTYIHTGWPIAREGKNERGGIFCNLDQDEELEIIYTVGNFVYVFKMNGAELEGWPQELNYPTDGVAAFGDIDGDGEGEVVVTTHQPYSYDEGSIYAFRKNGDTVPGFPIETTGGALRSPVLADINHNGRKEIIVAIRRWPEGFIHVYKGDGTMLEGWPQRLDYIPASEVAVGDITGDDIPEILAESYYSLNVFSAEGPMMPGFPFTPGDNRVFSYSSPVLADIDEDGEREIIFGDHSTSSVDGRVFILKNDGTVYPNWPKTTGSGIYAPPAVGDIDGDGILDVLVGEYGFGTDVYNVYAWNSLTGEYLPGFPIPGLNSVNTQIILADLDGDSQIELIFDDNTSAGIYHGYNHDGTPMDGWPLHVNGSSFYINPFVADLDGNGTIEISGGGYVPEENRTYLYLWQTDQYMNDELAILPVFQYNTRHNGVAGDYLMVEVPEPLPAISQNSILELEVNPNPATEHFMVYTHLKNDGNALLEMFDMSGKLCFTDTYTSKVGQNMSQYYQVTGLPDGLYTIRVSLEEEVAIGRVLIFN